MSASSRERVCRRAWSRQDTSRARRRGESGAARGCRRSSGIGSEAASRHIRGRRCTRTNKSSRRPRRARDPSRTAHNSAAARASVSAYSIARTPAIASQSAVGSRQEDSNQSAVGRKTRISRQSTGRLESVGSRSQTRVSRQPRSDSRQSAVELRSAECVQCDDGIGADGNARASTAQYD